MTSARTQSLRPSLRLKFAILFSHRVTYRLWGPAQGSGNSRSRPRCSARSMASTAGYIDATDVVQRLKREDSRMIVVDVRDDDFFEGHIKAAKQMPSGKFGAEKNIDEFISNIPVDVDLIVVHCQLSQVRGPKCARRLIERFQDKPWKGKETQPDVRVLRYGYDGFFDQMYSSNPELFEDVS